MPRSNEHLQAYMIIDNCFLVMLSNCFCQRFAARYPQSRVITETEKWMDSIVNTIKRFALDGDLYCSEGVVDEYNPYVGPMASRPGIQRTELSHLQKHIQSQLHRTVVENTQAQALRSLPAAPRQLVGSNGLSDNDLTLVRIGLELTCHNLPVFILSNDQSLLDFISWVRTQKQHLLAPIIPGQLQGWRCMTYLELVHRSCNIPSELMKELIEYALIEHYNRPAIAGSQKGNIILHQLMDVFSNFNQSVVIKKQLKAATT